MTSAYLIQEVSGLPYCLGNAVIKLVESADGPINDDQALLEAREMIGFELERREKLNGNAAARKPAAKRGRPKKAAAEDIPAISPLDAINKTTPKKKAAPKTMKPTTPKQDLDDDDEDEVEGMEL